MPVMVIMKVPVVALGLAVKVSTVEQAGVQFRGKKEGVTPEGWPEAVKATF